MEKVVCVGEYFTDFNLKFIWATRESMRTTYTCWAARECAQTDYAGEFSNKNWEIARMQLFFAQYRLVLYLPY